MDTGLIIIEALTIFSILCLVNYTNINKEQRKSNGILLFIAAIEFSISLYRFLDTLVVIYEYKIIKSIKTVGFEWFGVIEESKFGLIACGFITILVNIILITVHYYANGGLWENWLGFCVGLGNKNKAIAIMIIDIVHVDTDLIRCMNEYHITLQHKIDTLRDMYKYVKHKLRIRNVSFDFYVIYMIKEYGLLSEEDYKHHAIDIISKNIKSDKNELMEEYRKLTNESFTGRDLKLEQLISVVTEFQGVSNDMKEAIDWYMDKNKSVYLDKSLTDIVNEYTNRDIEVG